MVHPAVLEAEFQRSHIACGDQLPWLNAEVGRDLLHPALAVMHLDAAGRAEAQVVGPEGGAGEPEPQAGAGGEAAEGMAPGGGLRFLGVEAQVVHLIGNGQPAPLRAGLQLGQQGLQVAPGRLVGDQQAVGLPPGVGGAAGVVLAGLPLLQPQLQPLSRLQPLAGDRTAMAEHQKAPQPPLALQALKAEQGTQGLAGAGAGIDQHVVAAGALQASLQQLDQLRLPLAGLQRGRCPLEPPGHVQIKRQRGHPAILLPGAEKR